MSTNGIRLDPGSGWLSIPVPTDYDPNPLTANQEQARALVGLSLWLLNRQIVHAASVDECEPDLLHAVRDEVDRLGKFCNLPIGVGLEAYRDLSGALAVVDRLVDELLPAHDSSSPVAEGASTPTDATVDEAAGGALPSPSAPPEGGAA